MFSRANAQDQRLDFSAKHVNELLKGRAPITADSTERLERVLGHDAGCWLRLEASYQQDLVRLQRHDLSWNPGQRRQSSRGVRARPNRLRVRGATSWLSSDRALIALSLRQKTNDQLWFTSFHKACPILKHGKQATFVDGLAAVVDEEHEAEADRLAADQ